MRHLQKQADPVLACDLGSTFTNRYGTGELFELVRSIVAGTEHLVNIKMQSSLAWASLRIAASSKGGTSSLGGK